ncbi:Transcriptional regulatory protein LiaR [Streptomyces xanthophaeus]|uniref:LuxR C-terminal-related transcriptional regulator n=1 Tax=Streptomyces xanthophaeus TaxID=67385 RepID=UPI00233F4785|nr:response regulator transcription factor [Streptomyces xanthophaeus]WCD89133.1 Transcriptional regulatory protein LiaR [Streptomyces xanthophaeus]
MIEVVVVDDEPLIRAGLRQVLDATEDIRTTGAVPVAEAVVTIGEQEPQVVLLDCCTSDAPAIGAGLARMPAPPAVCVLSRYADEEYAALALASGACGYVLKDTDPLRFAPLVRFLAHGWTMMSADVSRTVVAGFLDGTGHRRGASRTARLTPREETVLVLIAAGLSNADIARRLHLAHGTVKDHVSTVLAKLEVTGRVQAALCAERAGLLTGDARR